MNTATGRFPGLPSPIREEDINDYIIRVLHAAKSKTCSQREAYQAIACMWCCSSPERKEFIQRHIGCCQEEI